MATTLHHSEHVELVANQVAVSTDAEQMIANSWRRCLTKHQLKPDNPPIVQVLETQQLRERSQRHDYLMGVSQQELVDLYNQLQGSGFNVFLTDADGIILQQVCDPVYAGALRRAGAHLGADWSEPNSGTNGVGTCIIEQRPLTVHLSHHFHTKHTGLSCSAAPIRDPHGNLLAVLDSSTASINSPCVDKHILGLVKNSATFIEGLYFLRLHRSDTVIYLGINPDIVPQPRAAMIAVSANGRITGANDRALQALGIPNRHNLLGREVQHLLDLRKNPLDMRTSGQIHQLKLIDRGTQVFATWQVPAPKTTNAYSSKTPLSELSDLVKPCTPKLCWGHDELERDITSASELYNQKVHILLQGETGTGKDTLARALHDTSPLKDGLFVSIDCCAASDDNLNSLFTESGDWLSHSLYPEGGTVFLNNVHLMTAELQAQALELMLRLERCNTQHPCGFQVITASRDDLQLKVTGKTFREDLFYRIAPYAMEIPPLRERHALQQLVHQLLNNENQRAMKQATFSEEAMQVLLQHPWQGNTRELENTLRTLVILSRHETIGIGQLPDALTKPRQKATEADVEQPVWTGLEAAEYTALLHELRNHEWNISATAKALSMSRNTLYRRMEKYAINPEQDQLT